ncbi:MAG: isochorismatase family protein [Tissierellia bacterium]|nr:isochorismatase family protein [Tissierellia bacterium]
MKHKLQREGALFLFIDIQDSLTQVMDGGQELRKNAKILAQTAEIMDIPTLFTTQYAKGLGPFDPEIRPLRPSGVEMDKKAFSIMLDEEIAAHLKEVAPKQIILSGEEAHICVLLSTRDLLQEGYEVYVVHDAVASRKMENKVHALNEMRDMGAVVRSTESILFDFNGKAGTPEFKAIQALIK